MKKTKKSVMLPSITDFKNQIEIAAIKSYACEVDPVTRRPLPNGSYHISLRSVPRQVMDLVISKLKELNPDAPEGLLCFYLELSVETLIHEAQAHKDDDWRNYFTCWLETPYGVKNLMYKNEHPTIEMLENMRNDFAKFYRDELSAGEDEKHICDMIAMELADYSMGEDFTYFFNEDLENLPDEVRTTFIEEAEDILAELKK